MWWIFFFFFFFAPADNTGKLKEDVQQGKYLEFARELKKLRKMKVPVLLIIEEALWMREKKF